MAHALWLFELSYDRRKGVKNEELLGRIARYVEGEVPGAAARLEALAVSLRMRHPYGHERAHT